jgi:hypothetical protein
MEIQTVIRYQDDIQFLMGIPLEKRDEYIRNAVTIGLRSIHMGEFTMDGRSYLDPLKDIMSEQGDRIVDFGDKLDTLLTVRTNSSRKGKLSESICMRVLEEKYTSVEFKDTANESYCGDCRGKFEIGDIMYEFKDYEKVVNSSEVVKFHRDLLATGIKFGVFVSNTSGISGKDTISWEIVGQDTIAVYVSQLGFNGLGCIVGTEFLLALQKAMVLDAKKGWTMRNDIQFSEYQGMFSECVDEYRCHLETISRVGNALHEVQRKTSVLFEPLHRELLMLRLNLEGTFRKMVGLREDIQENRSVIGQEKPIDEFLEGCDNHKSLYDTLSKLCDSESINVRCVGSELYGYDAMGNLVFKTKSIKSRLDILFVMKGDVVSLAVQYETIKGGSIVIEVKDNSGVWDLIRGRLSTD